jgi:hypothetical protein
MIGNMTLYGVIGAIAGTLSACSATQIQTAATNVAAMNSAAVGALQTTATSVSAACPVGQSVITAASVADPSLSVIAVGNGVFCAVNKAIAATSPVAASAPVAASQ